MSVTPSAVPRSVPGAAPGAPRVWPAFLAEWFMGIGSPLMSIACFFYAAERFGWDRGKNFLLAIGIGVFYVAGALLAQTMARCFGRRGAVVFSQAGMVLISAAAAWAERPTVVAGLFVCYGLLNGFTWPILSSLISSGVDAHTMSRRIAVFNAIWSGMLAVMVALNGTLLEHWPAGVFVIAALAHVGCAVAVSFAREAPVAPASPHDPIDAAQPEPELLRVRRLALWLSRICLPASLVVSNALWAILPTLPVMDSLDTSGRTVVSSIWTIVRFFTFIALGATVWWHSRPRVLLLSAALMLVAFMGMTLRGSELFGPDVFPARLDLAAMIGWQVVLGVVGGVIYCGSLYFGMVLSHGSTEHSGYHEALIGLGGILGPGIGALARFAAPGATNVDIYAVSGVIGASVILATIASVRLGRAK